MKNVNATSIEITRNSKLRTINSICLLGTLGTIALGFAKASYSGSIGLDEGSLFIIGCSFASIFLYLKQTGNIKRASFLLTGLVVLLLPFRTLMSGGLSSTVVLSYVGFCVFALILYGIKGGTVAFWYAAISMLLLGLMDQHLGLSSYVVEMSPWVQTLSQIIVLSLNALPISFLVKEKNQLSAIYQGKKDCEEIYLKEIKRSNAAIKRLVQVEELVDLYKEHRDPDLLPVIKNTLTQLSGDVAGDGKGGMDA